MANETTGRESDKFMLRLPDGMRDRIAEAAKASNRSMNAEIVARLQASFEPTVRTAGGFPLTNEGLEEMRLLAADAKASLRELVASLDRAEAVLLPEDAAGRGNPKPD